MGSTKSILRRAVVVVAAVWVVGAMGGCHLWSGGKMTATERAHVAPNAALEFVTRQRGTVVRLSNEGPADLTITYPADSERSWDLGPGDTWRHRLRSNRVVGIENRGDEPGKLAVWTKARNFRFDYDLREAGSEGDPSTQLPP